MHWGWIVRMMTGRGDKLGPFGYLAIRDGNRCQVKLERARQQAFKELMTDLPCGAVYRETTGDSQREIWIPPVTRPTVFVLPVVHHEAAPSPGLEPDRQPRVVLRKPGRPGRA